MTTNYNSICLKRGSTIKNSDYLGKSGEITIDTDKQIPIIHDGIRTGGHPLKRCSDNWIINGSFNKWQRGTTQTVSGYGSADRWLTLIAGSSATVTREAFTIGQTDVPGNPAFYYRINVTSATGADSIVAMYQKIEDVVAHSGQTIVVSYWAKADSDKPINTHFRQYFGSGGSPSTVVGVPPHYNPTLTTVWKKYFTVVDVPSVLGKVLGTDGKDSLWLLFGFDAGATYSTSYGDLGQQSGVFDIAEVKVEKGTVPTDIVHLHPAIENIMCDRYYRYISVIYCHVRQNSTTSLARLGSYSISPDMFRIPDYTVTTESGFSGSVSYSVTPAIFSPYGIASAATTLTHVYGIRLDAEL